MTDAIHPSDARHAAHVVAAFALRAPQRSLDRRMVPVLAYLADREHASKHGHPVLSGRKASTPTGPVDENVAALARKPADEPTWASLFWVLGHRLVLKDGTTDEDLDELSIAVVRSIDATWIRFGAMDPAAFDRWNVEMNGVPEWKPTRTTEITLEAMFQATGMTRADAEDAASLERERQAVARMLRG
jgi:hypothetical protein